MKIITLLFFVSLNLFAKPFANSFIEFNLPDTWECAPNAEDWICQAINPEQKKEAIVSLSSRTQKAGDNLQNYFKILSQPMKISDLKGNKSTSRPSYTQYKEILGNSWVDSQHNSSQLPGFITRYLATTKNGRALLISITVHESRYSFYMSDLYKMVESLMIRMSLPSEPTTTGVSDLLGQQLADVKVKKGDSKKTATVVLPTAKQGVDKVTVAIAIGAVAAGITIIILRRRKKKKMMMRKGL